jgi:hypothetical protein
MPDGVLSVESLYSKYASGLVRNVEVVQFGGIPAAGICDVDPNKKFVA